MRAKSGPRRVLHLIDTGGPGGAETVLASLVSALPDGQWRSRVVVPEADWLFGRLEEAGTEVVVVPSRGSADLRYLTALYQQIRQYRPALVQAHLLAAGVYGSLAARLPGGPPLVLTFHGAPDVNPDDRLLRLKGRILSRRRNRIVYVSENLRDRLERLLRLPSRLGRVIHNGIEFLDRAEAPGIRRELEMDPGQVLVGAVGNLRKPKDYPNLLQAARIALGIRPDLRFVVVGEGEGRLSESLLELRDSLGLAGRVDFLGFREDAHQVMSGFDIFVSSSSSEGLPLATLEAMGMGLPAVLTACGGPAEIVREGRTGLLVPPGDPEALAAGIIDLASHPEKAARMAEQGRDDVRDRFSRAGMVNGYTALYRELLGA